MSEIPRAANDIEESDDLAQYEIIAQFGAFIRRPEGSITGVKARLFGENGEAADCINALGQTKYHDALVHVQVDTDADSGGFEGYVRRPKPSTSGMMALFFGENGSAADTITALGLSKYLDKRASITVRLIQDANGRQLAKQQPKGPYSQQAKILWLYRTEEDPPFFQHPKVWPMIGSDQDFQDWVRQQKCCIDSKLYGPHEGRIVPMHNRRVADGAGTNIKPDYAVIPGCWTHHGIQTSQGYSAVGGRDFYDRKRIEYVAKWAKETLVKSLGYTSLTEIHPSKIKQWATARDLAQYLPPVYRNAQAQEA